MQSHELDLKCVQLRVNRTLCQELGGSCRTLRELCLRHQPMELAERANEVTGGCQELVRPYRVLLQTATTRLDEDPRQLLQRLQQHAPMLVLVVLFVGHGDGQILCDGRALLRICAG